MQFPKELTTVTPLSKALALMMFVLLPIITFLFGMRYQTLLTEQNKTLYPPRSTISPTSEPIGCTMDAKICPDGSAVGRVGPNCEFEKCPPGQTEGKKFSGIITRISYECHMDGICGIGVGKGFVILDKGEGSPEESRVKGTFPEDLLNEDKESYYLGTSVEVYAKKTSEITDSYTLFGSTEFYVALADDSITQTFCGGIAGKKCPSGYYCKYEGTYPDAGGTCIKNRGTTKFTCPKNEWVNCMPGPGSGNRIECTSDFLQWAQTNCPNFKGAAY